VRPLHRRKPCALTFLRRLLLSYIPPWTEKHSRIRNVTKPAIPAERGRVLTEDAGTTLPASFPGVLPDNRVVSGQSAYVAPLAGLTRGAAYIRGIVTGLDGGGADVLRRIIAEPELKHLLLIVAMLAVAEPGTMSCLSYSGFRTQCLTMFKSGC
jgi:hypothetical protein